MIRSLDIRPGARIDLFEPHEWLHARNPAAAEHLVDSARQTFEFLRTNPFVGRRWPSPPRRLAGVRVLSITGFPNLLVFYRPRPRVVEIVRVLHGAQDLDEFLRSGPS